MFELINILYLYLSVLIILAFPISRKLTNFRFDNNKNIFDIFLLNSIFLTYIFLICSFFIFSQQKIFFILMILSLAKIFVISKSFQIKKINLSHVIFFLISLSIVISIAYTPTLMWDGLAHWLFKTKVFFNNESVQKLHELPFSYYPHLGAYIWAFFWKNSFFDAEYTGRIYLVIIYIISIFSLLSIFKKNFGVYKKIFFIILFIFLTKDFSLFGGYQEYFIFVYLLLCSKTALEILYNQEKYFSFNFFIFLFSSFLLVFFKQEGLVYFIIINSLLLIFIKDSYTHKFFHFILIVILFVLNIYIKQFFSGNFAMNEIKVNFLLNFSFSDFLTIALFTFKHYLISIIKYPINIVIILIFFISLKNRSRITNFYLTYFVVSFLLINAIFQTYPGPIFNDIPLIIDRLILQMTGFYLPYLVFVLNNQFIREKNL
tara:strand:- start:235 stop:1527 length:1293 start_codon:yes stop_codon:yes gene_type:complete